MSSAELARLATSEGGGVFVGGGVSTVPELDAGIAEGTGTSKKGTFIRDKAHNLSVTFVPSHPWVAEASCQRRDWSSCWVP